MRDGIYLDRERWKAELDAFERRTGLDRAWVLRDVFRMLVNDLVRFSWPKSLKQGKGAVNRDLGKLFVPVSDTLSLSEPATVGGQRMVIARNERGAVYGVPEEMARLNASVAELRTEHQARRSSRSGHVRAGRGRRRVNGWTMVEKMHVPKKAWRKYRAEVWKRIGRVKAGWMAGVELFGGKAGRWISQHGTRESDAKDALNRDGSGYLMVANLVPYARRKILDSQRFSERRAQRNLGVRLEKVLERAERDYNRIRAGGGW